MFKKRKSLRFRTRQLPEIAPIRHRKSEFYFLCNVVYVILVSRERANIAYESEVTSEKNVSPWKNVFMLERYR